MNQQWSLRRLPTGLFAALGVFTACQPAQARTFYVAPNGNNSSPGTLAQPLADPARALNLASAGDTITLRGGRYNLTKPLSVSRDGLTIAAARGETVSLHAPIAQNAGVPNVFVITASRVTLSNLEIRGGSDYGVKVDVNDAKMPTRGVIIRHCRIADSGRDCIKTFNADQLLIESCDIGPSGRRDASNAEGIDSIGSHGVTVRNCFVHDTATNGIYFKGGATDGLIEGCRIQNTGRFAGLLLGQDTDAEWMRDGAKYEAMRCTARHNLIVNTGGAGMGTYSGDAIRFENNTLFNVARESGAGVWVGVNRRGVAARNVTLKNNIVVTSGARPLVFLLNAEGKLDADANLYFNAKGKGIFRIERAGRVTTLELPAWQRATGAEARSRFANPLLDAAKGFKPRAGSPALAGAR